MFKLNFLRENFPIKGETHIFKWIVNDNNDIQLFSYSDKELCNYYFENGVWKVSSIQSELLKGTQQIYVADTRDKGLRILYTLSESGIKIFQYYIDKLNLVHEDHSNVYHTDRLKYFLKFGHFFHDCEFVGAVTRHQESGLHFYKSIDAFSSGSFKLINTNADIFNQFPDRAKFYFSDLEGSGQESIIVQSDNGLNVYKFNENYLIERTINVECCNKIDKENDKLFFSKLTDGKYKNIVYINSTGLYLHRHDVVTNGYNFINYHPLFSVDKGWLPKFTDTVNFIDLDYDGREEMVFTGPQGISVLSYDMYSNQWQSRLDNSHLNIQQRHGYVVAVNRELDYQTIFINYQNRLHLANIGELQVEQSVDVINIVPRTNYSKHASPKLINPDEEKVNIFLRDQLDYSNILDGVDQSRGKLRFSLPLVNIPNLSIKLILEYDSSVNDILGYGWSFPNNLIFVDQQSSIFFEDHKYYIVFQNEINELIFDSIISDNVYSFKITESKDNDSEIKIYFYKLQEQWIIKNGDLKQIYGNSDKLQSAPVQWNLSWKYWRSQGSATKDRIRVSFAWYLSEVEDGKNNSLYFTYDSVENQSSSEANSKGNTIYLKEIADGVNNKLTIKYKEIDSNESTSGNLRLAGYELVVFNFKQDVDFIYTLNKQITLLTGIVQKEDDKPALQFTYDDNNLIKFVTLPLGGDIKFNYHLMNLPPESTKYRKTKIIIHKNYKIHYINNLILLTCINIDGKFEMEIFDENMKVINFTKSALPLLGNETIQWYEVLEGNQFMAIVLFYYYKKELFLFNWHDEKLLVQSKNISNPRDFATRITKDFIILQDDVFSFKLIEWDKIQWKETTLETKTNRSEKISIAASDRMFVIYDDSSLELWYKNTKKEWISKIIRDNVPNFLTNIENSLKNFDLSDEKYRQLIYYSKNNILQLNNNLLILTTLYLKGGQFYSEINLFVLNKHYDIVVEKRETIKEDYVTDISIERLDANGNTIELCYTLKNGKYVVSGKVKGGPEIDKVYADTDRLLEQIDKSTTLSKFDKTEARNKLERVGKAFKAYLLSSALDDFNKSFVLFDFLKYHANINSQLVIFGKKLFYFDGAEWKVEKLQSKIEKLSISLGNNYVLEQENINSTIKLFSKNKSVENYLFDLGVKHVHQIIVKFPIYIAYQAEGKRARIIEFSNEGEILKNNTLSINEKLTSWSNYKYIITEKNYNSQNFTAVVFRSVALRQRSLPDPVVVESLLTLDDNSTRSTGYYYNVSSLKMTTDSLFYEETTLIPGNDKTSFGWIQTLSTKDGKNKIIFNGNEEIVKTETTGHSSEENTKENGTETTSTNTILFDKYNNLPVAQFYPYEINSKVVSFYGFEEYESNIFENENIWKFNTSSILNNKFSFTGKNLLRLNPEENLEGTFYPRSFNNITFVASTWVRSELKILKIGSVVPYLRIIVSDQVKDKAVTFLSEVKLHSNGWYYLESIVNLYYAKLMLGGTVSTTTLHTSNVGEDQYIKMSVIVGSGLFTNIDVDHVRFSPINCKYLVNVYSNIQKNIRETIQFNGSVKRYFYDLYQADVATIDEHGQLVHFKTYTKVSGNRGNKQPKCIIDIQPESGFYEDFSPNSLNVHWNIEKPQFFQISPSQLQYKSTSVNNIQLKIDKFNKLSYGIRMYYSLKETNSYIKIQDLITLICNKHKSEMEFLNNRLEMPSVGEILIVVEGTRLFIWIDGGLYIDSRNEIFTTFSGNILNIEMRGSITLKEVLAFSSLSVRATYVNALGEKIQEIKLEDENNVIIREFLYDERGRQSITTKPARLQLTNDQSALKYFSNLILNKDPRAVDSIFKNSKLEGGQLNDGSVVFGKYDFFQVLYNNNPLDEVDIVGYPGKEFSVQGDFSKRYTSSTSVYFIKEQYPVEHGYRYLTEHKYEGVKEILVFDRKDNKVAWYLHVPKGKDLLCTYEYDLKNRLIKQLPPLYHEKVKTLYKFSSHRSVLLENEQLEQHKALGTYIEYDEKGNAKSKITPNGGKIEYIYDENGLMKFNIYYSQHDVKKVENILMFQYDQLSRLSRSSFFKSPPEVAELLKKDFNNNGTMIGYQEFYYNDADSDPTLRGQLKRTITFNAGDPIIEESFSNFQQNTLYKRIITPVEEDKNLFIEINKRFIGDKVKYIQYPVEIQNQPFTLEYHYNKHGKVVEIGVADKSSILYRFGYNPSDQLDSTVYYPGSANRFTRYYAYNERGFLVKMEDKYLIERIYYTVDGYGSYGYGDGTITRTEFTALWHNYTNSQSLALNRHSFINKYINKQQSELCFNKLKETNYINSENHQKKILYSQEDIHLPNICNQGVTGRHIANILGKLGFPERYGHIYDYGNHMEMIKAKYFVGNDIPRPLQPETFARLHPELINTTTSRDLWQNLIKFGFIVQDDDKNNLSTSHGKQRKSIISSSLATDLNGKYLINITKLLGHIFSNRQTLSFTEFLRIFMNWKKESNVGQREEAKHIFEILNKNNYSVNPLSEEFQNVMKQYDSDILPDIVKILLTCFAKELGEAEFDVESYSIDSHGNHKLFYIGFNRYKLGYEYNTDRIDKVQFSSYNSLKSGSYSIKYDSRGNVVQATHKGIKQIFYNQVVNLVSKIELDDGRTIKFHYDASGERILKKVINSQGLTIKEIHYIRDETGRSFVERELNYVSTNQKPDLLVTAYIYGPQGLLGFIRRDEYYSVISDHENSIRLVVKNDEIVAAYDYFPYGTLMREYAAYPEAHIRYRYIGQELDEELGLYNLHARLYDPSIGRFYQIDPKEQYFSPYLYAGNSPISLSDPDGEFALLIVISLGAIVGAFLGGAVSNNTFNITKWNFKSFKTWFGMIASGFGTAMLPLSFLGSVTAIISLAGLHSSKLAFVTTTILGLAGSYLGMANANNEWNPTKWDYTSPVTWKGALSGFSLGSGAIGGLRVAGKIFTSLSTIGKAVFIGSSAIIGGFILYRKGNENRWDFSKPRIWYEIIDQLINATDYPIRIIRFPKLISMIWKNLFKFFNFLNHFSHINKASPMVTGYLTHKSPSMTYLFEQASKQFLKIWDISSVGTYKTVVNNIYVKSDIFEAEAKFSITSGTNANFISEYLVNIATQNYKNLIHSINKGLELEAKNKPKTISDKSSEKIPEILFDTMQLRTAITINAKYLSSIVLPDDAPNLMMYFTPSKISSPIVILENFSYPNISGNDVENYFIKNTNLIKRMAKTQQGIIEEYLKKFKSKIETVRNCLDKVEGLNTAEKDRIKNILQEIIQKNKFMIKGRRLVVNAINSYIDEIIQAKIDIIKENLNIEKNLYKEKLIKLKTLGYWELNQRRKQVSEEMTILRQALADKDKEINFLQRQLRQEILRHIEKFLLLLHNFHKYITFWASNNHIKNYLSIYSRMDKIEYSKSTFNDKSVDLIFKSSKRLSTCIDCKVDDSYVDYIRDPDWSQELNNHLLGDNSIKMPYFLVPIYMLMDNDDKQMIDSSTKHRHTRSVPYSTVSNESWVNDTANIVPSKIPYWRNFFNWINNKYIDWFSAGGSRSGENRYANHISDYPDLQSSLLLANVFVSKMFNSKIFVPKINSGFTYAEALVCALNITNVFENNIKHQALKYRLPMENIDFTEVQKDIIKTILANKLDEINKIINSRIINTFSKIERHQLKNYHKFTDKMNGIINKFVNVAIKKLIEDHSSATIAAYTQKPRINKRTSEDGNKISFINTLIGNND